MFCYVFFKIKVYFDNCFFRLKRFIRRILVYVFLCNHQFIQTCMYCLISQMEIGMSLMATTTLSEFEQQYSVQTAEVS